MSIWSYILWGVGIFYAISLCVLVYAYLTAEEVDPDVKI